MEHLASLELDLNSKTVLDLGCGAGDLAQFFVERDCSIVCLDARQENIDLLSQQYPDLTAHVANVETESLGQFGEFDIVFCYGLLYHLENPIAALRNMRSACKSLLLLSTMVTDHSLPVVMIVDEENMPTQALHGLGCRPSPSYITMVLKRVGFPYVYVPTRPPDHPDFLFDRIDRLDWHTGKHPLRCVFIASLTELDSAHLKTPD